MGHGIDPIDDEPGLLRAYGPLFLFIAIIVFAGLGYFAWRYYPFFPRRHEAALSELPPSVISPRLGRACRANPSGIHSGRSGQGVHRCASHRDGGQNYARSYYWFRRVADHGAPSAIYALPHYFDEAVGGIAPQELARSMTLTVASARAGFWPTREEFASLLAQVKKEARDP